MTRGVACVLVCGLILAGCSGGWFGGSFSEDSAAAAPQGTAPADSAPDHSDTNVQVEGVDEADIVKTDGNYLYILHGRTLSIVAAWYISASS